MLLEKIIQRQSSRKQQLAVNNGSPSSLWHLPHILSNLLIQNIADLSCRRLYKFIGNFPDRSVGSQCHPYRVPVRLIPVHFVGRCRRQEIGILGSQRDVGHGIRPRFVKTVVRTWRRRNGLVVPSGPIAVVARDRCRVHRKKRPFVLRHEPDRSR